MSMRITGLATGMDIDQLVKDTMNPYRIKIQQVQQNKEITEIKQQLYREVIKDSRDFYNKHLDITKSDSILRSSSWGTVSFTSSDSAAVTARGLGGASAETYTIDVQQLASAAKATLTTSEYNNDSGTEVIKVTIGTETPIAIDLASVDNNDNTAVVNAINTALTGKGVSAKYSTISGGIVFESTAKGVDQTFQVTYGVDASTQSPLTVTPGTNALVKFKDSNGNELYTYNGTSNKVAIDNTEFTFNNVTTVDATLTPTIDATSTKDKIVSFINDYNTLIEKLNTFTSEKRNRDFMPLTDEQKKSMSEKEIELWEAKVKKGQLSRDSDLMRISNGMKTATKSMFSGSLSFLEKVGINPVADYSGTKNGTFTIDEDKLTSALENNAEDIMKLFVAPTPTDGTESEKYNGTGVFQRIKTILYDETMTSTSRLLKKVGFEGTSVSYNNELTKSIAKYEQKMEDMESIFSRREQQLYTKYASLETMMNNLNSQQSYLMSQLGMG